MSSNEQPMPPDPLKASPAPEDGADKPLQQGEQVPHPMAAAGAAEPIAAPPGATENDSSYKVGKGRPPLHSRFKPGQSGNPNGRPKGRKNEKTLLEDIIEKPRYSLREGNRLRKISLREVILRRSGEKAGHGDLKHSEFLFNRYDAAVAGEPAQIPLNDDDRKVIESFLKEAQVKSDYGNK
jgi:Family of unknown function (DUF5681)